MEPWISEHPFHTHRGLTAALLFESHGFHVTLIDNATDIMARASNNHEGKIHMGFVYSGDKSLQTGRHMMESALNFGYVLDKLLGSPIAWDRMKSTKFMYLVPHTSLVPPDELEAYFEKLQGMYEDVLAQSPHLHYLGERPKRIFRRVPVPARWNRSFFAAAFETEEYAVRHPLLKDMLQDALHSRQIDVLLNTWVSSVQWQEDVFQVQTSQGTLHAGYVVNCLWEGKPAIDKAVGVDDSRGTNVRLKFGIETPQITALAKTESVTIVNGPFGDFVNFPSHRRMYFSWYAKSMIGMLVDEDLPLLWKSVVQRNVPQELGA